MRNPPTISVWLGGAPAGLPVVRFEIIKAFGKHTVATLDMRYGPETLSPAASVRVAPEWTPVVVRQAIGAVSDTWYGYVHGGGVNSDNRNPTIGGSVVRYTLIGTSLPLNEERTRSWKGVSRSGLARSIANKHRFRTIIQRDPAILPYVAQAGESDWQVLKRLASENGYRFWVDGSTLLFVKPTTLLSGVRMADIATYTQNKLPGMPDGLVKWDSKSSSLLNRAGQTSGRHLAYGLDARTKRVLQSSTSRATTGTPIFTRIDTSQRLGSDTVANRATEANAAVNRAWITAQATVAYSPKICPGSVVNIQGRRVPEAERGLWLVSEARHRVLRDHSAAGFEYVSILELERHAKDSPTFTSAFRTINTRDSVPATMRDGIFWEAEVMEDVRVG